MSIKVEREGLEPIYYDYDDYLGNKKVLEDDFIKNKEGEVTISIYAQEFESMRRNLLFGAYFFFSPKMYEHSREVFNIWHLIGEFGGIFMALYQVNFMLAVTSNQYLFWGKMIRHLFIFKNSNNDEHSLDGKPRTQFINFKFLDKFGTLKWNFYSRCCCAKNPK